MDKQKIRFWLGTFLISLPDFDSGVILTTFVLLVFKEPFTLWPFLVGEVSAVVFDLDIVIYLLRGHKIAFDHRLLFHKPILVLPTWLLIAWWSPLYATVVATCLLAHLMDDCIGNSQEWGVQLLWPFSSRTYVFFSTREGVSKIVRSYEPNSYQKVAHTTALENTYLRFGPKSKFTAFWTAGAVIVGIFALVQMIG